MSESGPDALHGLYRGTVEFNIDPEQRGRLLLAIPDALSFIPSTWVEPCAPLSGPVGTGMGVYMVPPKGAAVWVMFEHGDINRPVWMGCRFDTMSDAPADSKLGNPLDPNIIIQSMMRNMLMVSDMPPTPATGGIVLRSASGAMIVVNDGGIYLNNGKGATISLVGSTINFNLGAMTII